MIDEEEIEECKNDPAYFYENYCLVNGKKPKLSDSQKEELRLLTEVSQIALIKSRFGRK